MRRGSGRVTPQLVLEVIGPCRHQNPIPVTGGFPCRNCRHMAYRKLPDYREKELAKEREAYWRDPESKRQYKRNRNASLRAENPEKISRDNKRWALKTTYRMTIKRFEELLASQGSRCAVCNNVFAGERDCHVDHDHSCCPGKKSCGKCVRGILCGKCNIGLGSFMDSAQVLVLAAEYLRRFQKPVGIPFLLEVA